MLLDGKQVALTTGKDVGVMQEKLFRSYFHLPAPTTAKKRKKPR